MKSIMHRKEGTCYLCVKLHSDYSEKCTQEHHAIHGAGRRKLSEKYQELLRAKAPVFLTLAFLFPFFPDDMLCILAGLTELSFRHFAAIVLLTRPWGLLFASALGGASLGLSPWVMVPIALLALVIFLFGLKYGDRLEKTILHRLKERKSGETE